MIFFNDKCALNISNNLSKHIQLNKKKLFDENNFGWSNKLYI